jgi:hypothetical protein
VAEGTDANANDAQAESIEAMNRATEMIRASARAAHEARDIAERLQRENAELIASKAKVDADLVTEKETAKQRACDHAKQLRDTEANRHMQTLRCLQDTLSACGGGAAVDLSALAGKDPDERDRLIADTAMDMVAQADNAIKGMTQSSQKRVQEMDTHVQREKRARDEADVAKTRLYDVTRDLQHFGGLFSFLYLLRKSARSPPPGVLSARRCP